MKTEVKNAVVHHMHAVSKLAEIDHEAFGIYSERMQMTLQLTALMKEAFQNQMSASEFDKRCAVILGSDIDAVAQLKQEIENISARFEKIQNDLRAWGQTEADEKRKAENIGNELRQVLKHAEARRDELAKQVEEVHKIMASQREQINTLEGANKLWDDEYKRLKAEHDALKNASTPK